MNCPPVRLNHFQTGQRTGTGGETVLFEPQSLKNAHEQVRQWIIILLVKGQVLAMSEAATGKDDRHVAITVTGGISQIARQEDRCLIEQTRTVFLDRCEVPQEVAVSVENCSFYDRQLIQFFIVSSVMTVRFRMREISSIKSRVAPTPIGMTVVRGWSRFFSIQRAAMSAVSG